MRDNPGLFESIWPMPTLFQATDNNHEGTLSQ
jgi:hypothetical protein